MMTATVPKPAITLFEGRYEFLSNFFPAQVRIMVGPRWVKCQTVEHAYQASKTLDPRKRMKIIEAETPGMAKRLGQKVDRVCYWDDVKTIIMLELLRQKFSRSVLRKRLTNTGARYLMEGNTWHDNFWGECLCEACWTRRGGTTGPGGENWLGRLLMRVRADVR